MNSTHRNSYRKQLFKVIRCCRRTVFPKFPHAVQSYPKCWGNIGQQYFSFWFIQNLMPYNLNIENIIIHNKTRDMLPFIFSTILHVRCSEHANSKSVQSPPIWRYIFFNKKMHLKMSSANRWPFYLSLNVYIDNASVCHRYIVLFHTDKLIIHPKKIAAVIDKTLIRHMI